MVFTTRHFATLSAKIRGKPPRHAGTPRRKFAVEANVESRVNRAWELIILAAFRKWLGGNRAKGLLPEPLAIIG